MNEDGEMETLKKTDLKEGVYLELDGIWFEVFLWDEPHSRYFLEVMS